MGRKNTKKSLRRGLIEEIYNSAPMPAQQTASENDYAPSFNSGMSRDEIANIYNSYTPESQEIPTLEQNTTPTTPTSTPSIADELERMKKAKADTTTPRTEGEKKAIDTYYDSLMKASGQKPSTSTPKVDYRAEIDRMNALKADTTVQRTEGENQAIETYLKGLEEAQRYLDSQKPKTTVKKTANGTTIKTETKTPESKKIGTVEIRADGTKKYTKTMSANEQRDYERALMAQAKAIGKEAKKNTADKGRVLSPNEQRDLDRANEAIAKAKERQVVEETKAVNAPATAKGIEKDQLQYGQIKQTKDASSDYDERGFKKNSAIVKEYLDPNKKLTRSEEKYAKKLINDYEASDLGQLNENAYTLAFDDAHPDGISVPYYTVEYDEQGIPRYNPSKEISPEDREYRQNMGKLKTKVQDSESFLVGAMQTVPFVDALQKAGDVDGEYANMVANAQKQNPLSYFGGLLGTGVAMNLAGQYALKGTQYGDKIAKLFNADKEGISAKSKFLRQILTDASLDMPVDVATDIVPTLAADYASGKRGKDLALSTGANVGLNAVLNLIPAYLGNVGEYRNAKKALKASADATEEALNPLEMAAKNAEIENVVQELNSPNPINEINLTPTSGEMGSVPTAQELSGLSQATNNVADSLSTSNVEQIGKSVNPNNDLYSPHIFEDIADSQADEIIAPAVKETNDIVEPAVKQADEGKNPIQETLDNEFPTAQTPEMRAKQNAEVVSQKVQPKDLTQADSLENQDVRRWVDSLEMPDETRTQVSKQLDELEGIIDKFNKSKDKQQIMDSMDEFEKKYTEIENALKQNAKAVEMADDGVKEEKRRLANALKGQVINLSNLSKAEIPDSTMRDLNNALFTGTGSGRFVRKGGTPIDSIFNEIDMQTGGALTSYMMRNGLDPDVTENQAKGLVGYMQSLKSTGKPIREEAYQGGLLDDAFERMIRSASERGLDIDENALRKKQFVSAFRTHNQGNFGLTDEELNNKYFNTQNENFRFLKGDRAGDIEKATQNLETNYEGTVNKLLDKPTTQQFTPQEVDEGFMAWRRELDNARETGDYQKAANIMYRMTQDAHEKGAGLQAYAAYKKNTPAGVVLDATEAARDMAVDKTSKKYVAKIDDLVNKVNELQNSGLSFEEQERQLMEYMREIQKRGYKNGINGFEQMKELLKTGTETREMLYEDLKKAGRVTTLEDFKEMLKTGRLTREMVYEDLNKAGHSISLKDVDDMLKSARGVDAVGIKDILYEANKLPNIDAQAQKKIADLAQEMFGKELTDVEKRKYINQINMVLSSQRNWSIKDKAVEIAHIMMLSGTKTHLRNILANIGMLPQAGLARKISAVGQNAYAFFNKDYTPTQAFFVGKDARKLASEALEKMGGASAIAEGVADKYSNRLANQIGANYMFGTGKKNIVSKASDALDKIPFLKSAREGIGEVGSKALKKIGSEGAYDAMDANISTLENYRQLIYGSLSGLEDNPFVKRNFEDRLASYIKAQGIKNLSEIPEEAFDIARAEALKATFKDENAWTSLFSSLKKFPVVGETLLPFTKTPANLIARSIDYSPIGLARELAGILGHAVGRNNKFTRDTVGEMFDELAKGLSGTILGAAATLGLYANGVITGKEDEDYNIAKYMQEEGWRPYALSTKGMTDFVNGLLGTDFDLGDSYIPFDWLQPSTTNIVAMEELYDELTNGDKISDKTIDDIFQRVKSIGGSYVSSLLEQSTLQNVSELFGSKYNDQSTGENLVDAIMQLPTRYFSGALSDITKLEDPTKREYYSKNKPVETAFNLAVSKTPFASKNLPAKYDLFGNEVKTADSQAGNVIKTLFDVSNSAKKTDDKHYNYIDTLNSQTTTGDYIPTTPARNIKLNDESKKLLDNKEYSKLRQVSGQERSRLMDNALQNKEFNSLTADEKAYVLTQLDTVAIAKGDLAVVDNPKMSKDVSELLDMTDDERIKKLAEDAKKITNKSALEEQNLPNSDFFVEAMQNGEDLSKWKEYGEILNNAEKDDSEKRRKLYESGYLEKAMEYGVDGYDSKSAMQAFKDGEYENYAGYRQELERTGMKDSEENWNEYMKQIHAKGEADLTNVKNIAPEQTASVQQELVALGMPDEIYSVQKYDRAKSEIPTLSPAQFVTTFNSIDSKDKKNGTISQGEVITYLNDAKVKDKDKGMQIWNAYLSNSTESTVPVLQDDGTWTKKTTRKKKKS